MHIATFLGHYQIVENPFHAEEARHDSVFTRVETACHHPDFEKILGDFTRPSSAIVFGERGSGKTAIRLQIEQRLAQHNREQPELRCLPLMYDELNPVLDRFSRNVKKPTVNDTLKDFRLVDHIDAMMNSIVPRIVDQVLGESRIMGKPLTNSRATGNGSGRGGESGGGGGSGGGGWPIEIDGPPAKRFRQLDAQARHDLLTLQLHYDRPESHAQRTRRLKRAIRYRSSNPVGMYRWLAGFSALATAAMAVYFLIRKPPEYVWLWQTTIVLLLAFTLLAFGRFAFLWWSTHRLAKELSRKLRVLDWPASSIRASLLSVNAQDIFGAGLPRTNDDDMRYAMFGRLLNVVRTFGYKSILVLVDRVDEPTLINGEPDRMRALVWPLLNNKFLQQDRVGVKLLLPLELRHLLNRETGEFFREARLDKQNLIERLTWSGAMLYDLCSARLNACRAYGASSRTIRVHGDAQPQLDGASNNGEASVDGSISLKDLFEDTVTRQDLVDALDQMQQPRDAFKFIYQLMQEHCSNVPEESPQWKIPRPVLDSIRKQQVERMTGMLRGVRPG